MKYAEAIESISCTCPYCNKALIFENHPIIYEFISKAIKQTCYKCKKIFWLKPE